MAKVNIFEVTFSMLLIDISKEMHLLQKRTSKESMPLACVFVLSKSHE